MQNTNHLQIDKALKKELNDRLKLFRKYRVSEGVIKPNNKKKKDFLGFLFKEYDNMNDLMKDLF